MSVFKKWLIRVNFDDGSYSKGISKKDFRENDYNRYYKTQ